MPTGTYLVNFKEGGLDAKVCAPALTFTKHLTMSSETQTLIASALSIGNTACILLNVVIAWCAANEKQENEKKRKRQGELLLLLLRQHTDIVSVCS